MAQRKEIPDILGPELKRANVLDDVLTGGKPTRVAVASIRHDGATQMRAGLAQDTVDEYTQAMIDAGGFGTFPPMVVFHDGTDYWLGDGFHRLAAFKEAFPGHESLHILCDVRVGTRRDAMLFAAGANATHGLRRTNADKRRAVETLLRDEEWSQWSDNEIAHKCNVSHPFVGSIRKSLVTVTSETPGYTRTYTNKHGGTSAMNTANIGSNQSQRATGSHQNGAQLATCRICHRPLSDPASAIAGVGPCCAAKRTMPAGGGTADDDDDQPLRLASVEDDDDLDILTPDRHEAGSTTQTRNQRIDNVLRRLRDAQDAIGEFQELTGAYTLTLAFRRSVQAMVAALEGTRV